jgi:DNA-binding NarL/FixJ family response regulator
MANQWPLTGRDEELRLVAEALGTGDHTGIVIAGPAGVGKTRLARVAADAAAQAATSHRLAGRRGSALTASSRAHLLAKNCGGAVSPALNAARVPLPFTRREHEIAKLVSDGRSNKQIAEATSLSIRTVEGHIYQASAKAGVSSLSELSTLVQQFNEV